MDCGSPQLRDTRGWSVRVLRRAVGSWGHDVRAAIPLLLFVTGVVESTLPLPEATWKVTATPCTGLPLASCTITDGGELTALPAGADCVVGLLAAIAAAAPALSVIAAVAGVSPVAPKLSV